MGHKVAIQIISVIHLLLLMQRTFALYISLNEIEDYSTEAFQIFSGGRILKHIRLKVCSEFRGYFSQMDVDPARVTCRAGSPSVSYLKWGVCHCLFIRFNGENDRTQELTRTIFSGRRFNTALAVKRFRLHPSLRVKHLSRESGGSHLLELSRQRLLLEREKDITKYMRKQINPFPEVGELHSQRKRARLPNPFSSLLRKDRISIAKSAFKNHKGTTNSVPILMLKAKMKGIIRRSKLLQANNAAVKEPALLKKLWCLNSNSSEVFPSSLKPYLFLEVARKKNMNRPLGCSTLFVRNVDLRISAFELENFLQNFTRGPVSAHLKVGDDGEHLGYGLLKFSSCQDATICLLQVTGVKVGRFPLLLMEAFYSSKARAEERLSENERNEKQTPPVIQYYPVPLPINKIVD